MYDATTNNLIIREWLNGSCFPLSFNLAFIIGVFLWQSYLESRKAHTPSWWNTEGVPTACSLFWLFGSESVRAGWVWLILRLTNDGVTVPDYIRELANYSFIAAATVFVIMVLRCTYLFTPPKWKNQFWVYSAVVTIVFLLLSHFIPSK